MIELEQALKCFILYFSMLYPMLEVHMGYSWDIRGIFTEYSWNIRMYRVCIGYVSGMYREYIERNRVREMKLTTMATTGAAINTLPRYEGDDSNHGRARRSTEI